MSHSAESAAERITDPQRPKALAHIEQELTSLSNVRIKDSDFTVLYHDWGVVHGLLRAYENIGLINHLEGMAFREQSNDEVNRISDEHFDRLEALEGS